MKHERSSQFICIACERKCVNHKPQCHIDVNGIRQIVHAAAAHTELYPCCSTGHCNSIQQTKSLGPRSRPERVRHSRIEPYVGVPPTCAHDSIISLKSMTNRTMHWRFPKEAFLWAGGTHQTNSPFYPRVDHDVNKFVFLEIPSIT